MPPKAKFTKEEIVKAALGVARRSGIDAVTAREIGAALGVSTRPIFTYYNTMDEMKSDVAAAAKELYASYIQRGLSMPVPFLGAGIQFIQFAKDEPELYKLLFLTGLGADGATHANEALRSMQELSRESLMRIYHMDAQTADSYCRDMWLVGNSICVLTVTGGKVISDEEIPRILSNFSLSLCKAYKEIPGFMTGDYDKNEQFKLIIKEQDK